MYEKIYHNSSSGIMVVAQFNFDLEKILLKCTHRVPCRYVIVIISETL